MPLINSESNLILNWSAIFVIAPNTASDQAATFGITDAKLYVPVLALPSNNSAKLLQQLKLKSGFKGTIKWNKYHSKAKRHTRNEYLDYLTDPSFEGINKLFVLSYVNNAYRRLHTEDIFFQL